MRKTHHGSNLNLTAVRPDPPPPPPPPYNYFWNIPDVIVDTYKLNQVYKALLIMFILVHFRWKMIEK